MSGPDFTRLLVSVHIPKTGGQSFQQALEMLTPQGVIPDYENRPLAPDPVPRRIKQHRLDMARMGLIMERLRDTNDPVVVHGHFLSGKYRSIFPGARFLCWFRDPVERICSHYAYWKRTSKLLRGIPENEKPSLEEFASMEVRRNVQSRFLCSTRLDSFDFVGITSQFERSLRLFQAWSGIPGLQLPMVNKNWNRTGGGYELSPAERARVEALNALDMEIFPRALARFETLCAAHEGALDAKE